jgi:hypothetical protein
MRSNPVQTPTAASSGAFLQALLRPVTKFKLPWQSAQQKDEVERAAAEPRGKDWADLCRYRAANAALTNRSY